MLHFSLKVTSTHEFINKKHINDQNSSNFVFTIYNKFGIFGKFT